MNHKMPLLAQVHIWGVPGDLAALALLAVGLLAFGLSGGQRFSVAFLVSLYIAMTLVATLPALRSFLLQFSVVLPSQTNAVAFVISVAFSTWLLAGTAIADLFHLARKGFRAWWQISLASLLGTGLFAALFFPMLPRGTWEPSALLNWWFLADPMPFIWALAPIFFFVVLRTEK